MSPCGIDENARRLLARADASQYAQAAPDYKIFANGKTFVLFGKDGSDATVRTPAPLAPVGLPCADSDPRPCAPR